MSPRDFRRGAPPVGGIDAGLEVIAAQVVDAAVKLHVALGPGLLESAYEVLLARVLERRGSRVQRQLAIALEYDGIRIEEAFRPDLIVGGRLVVELKSIERLAPVHFRQMLTYLRILRLPLGLLLNFGEPSLKSGLHRILNQSPVHPFV